MKCAASVGYQHRRREIFHSKRQENTAFSRLIYVEILTVSLIPRKLLFSEVPENQWKFEYLCLVLHSKANVDPNFLWLILHTVGKHMQISMILAHFIIGKSMQVRMSLLKISTSLEFAIVFQYKISQKQSNLHWLSYIK